MLDLEHYFMSFSQINGSKKKRERGLSFDLIAKRDIHPHEEV